MSLLSFISSEGEVDDPIKEMKGDYMFCETSPPLYSAVAELKAKAAEIESETELSCQTEARKAEIEFLQEQNELVVARAKSLSAIDVS